MFIAMALFGVLFCVIGVIQLMGSRGVSERRSLLFGCTILAFPP